MRRHLTFTTSRAVALGACLVATVLLASRSSGFAFQGAPAAQSTAQDTKPPTNEIVDAVDSDLYFESEFVERTVFGVDDTADRLLRSMGDYLASAPALSFRAEISEDSVLPTGQQIQYGGSAHVAVQRPGSLHAHFEGQRRHTRVFIDGGRCTIFDMESNLYAAGDTPTTLDAAIDFIVSEHGFTVPLADLVYADPYATLIENVDYGIYVGSVDVDGVECAHLAFAQETIDWQIWIEIGPRPVPRKLLITYRSEPGAPQYTARISEWQFAPRLASEYFQFQPPPDSRQVEFMPRQDAEETR